MIMESSTTSDKAQQALSEADAYVRENPIPALFCALGIGFALGLLVRALDRPTASDLLEEKMQGASGYLGALFGPVAKQTKRAYHKSADAVRDAVDQAKEIDVEDYTDPITNWFSRMWKKCCS